MLDDKLQLMSALIQAWSCCSVCQQRELESFLGHLSHAATVIQQGCPFLRGLFQLLSVARQPHHFVWLTRGAKANILWLLYLKKWNGRFFPQDVPSVHVYTDTSGSIGCSSFQLTGYWFKLVWPCDLHRSIAALELLPVVVAAMLWGDNWHGKLVCFHSDNEAVVNVLNKGHTQDVALSHLMRPHKKSYQELTRF